MDAAQTSAMGPCCMVSLPMVTCVQVHLSMDANGAAKPIPNPNRWNDVQLWTTEPADMREGTQIIYV